MMMVIVALRDDHHHCRCDAIMSHVYDLQNILFEIRSKIEQNRNMNCSSDHMIIILLNITLNSILPLDSLCQSVVFILTLRHSFFSFSLSLFSLYYLVISYAFRSVRCWCYRLTALRSSIKWKLISQYQFRKLKSRK